MKKTPSIRQRKYAYGIMNETKTKYQSAIDAGFSPSTARVPFLIENKLGFKLAIMELSGQLEASAMRVMFELQARDLSKVDNKTLLSFLDVISRTHERFSSKLA